MSIDSIKIFGAREHNLKNIDLVIPRNKLTTLVGVSGSGKSTVAFDIIHAEGQRQYLESISTYAARLLQKADRPDIDAIEGLSSTIMIEQRQIRGSLRSTVGTLTELYTYLRLLFSRAGSTSLSAAHFSFNNPLGACKKCKGVGFEITIDLDHLVDDEKNLTEGAINHSLYKPNSRYMNILRTTGKIDFEKPLKSFTQDELNFLLYSPLIKYKNSEQGFVQSYSWEGVVNQLIKRSKDSRGISETKEKRDGLFWIKKECSECHGYRLDGKILESKINGRHIGQFAELSLYNLKGELAKIDSPVAKPICERMISLLDSLIEVGIGYLSLNRSTDTLSAGEAQRVKLARELGSNLIETIYILDEPTAGLHPRDIKNLIGILKKIRDSQNTVIVVEHNGMVISESDYLLELGPGAGKNGGNIIATGTPDDIKKNNNSLTGKYFSIKNKNSEEIIRRKPRGFLEINNANLHNLKNVSVKIPTGIMVTITGVSGSGKSTLINDIFVREYRDKVTLIDQSPIGTSPRANIATYSKVFDDIRELLAKENHVSKALFSFNSKGACPECNGLGYVKVDMHLMADVKVSCETCEGKRFTKEVLEYKYRNKNIYEILEMTVDEALEFFDDDSIKEKLSLLREVGLEYVTLGQTLDTLSGGESQRLKLASRLNKKNEFYVMDEPTSGLHFADIEKLLKLFNRLVSNGNSVLVIEHNLRVIKKADWIIDLGPEGGDQGGKIIAQGTPEEIAKVENSYTGQFLKKLFYPYV